MQQEVGKRTDQRTRRPEPPERRGDLVLAREPAPPFAGGGWGEGVATTPPGLIAAQNEARAVASSKHQRLLRSRMTRKAESLVRQRRKHCHRCPELRRPLCRKSLQFHPVRQR